MSKYVLFLLLTVSGCALKPYDPNASAGLGGSDTEFSSTSPARKGNSWLGPHYRYGPVDSREVIEYSDPGNFSRVHEDSAPGYRDRTRSSVQTFGAPGTVIHQGTYPSDRVYIDPRTGERYILRRRP